MSWTVIFLLLRLSHISFGAYFDYTDFDDPFQVLLNTKNQVAPEPNSPCSGNVNNMPLEGVCKSRTECQLTGGTSAGFCGLLSTCCVYMGSCGNKISAKISYFTSLNVPNSQTCKYQVKLHNRSVCQLRLDMIYMNLAPPAADEPNIGTCREEKFFVEGYPNIPRICGVNSNQHMYIPVNGNDSNPVTLHIDLLPQPVTSKSWFIKVTQLQCPGITIFPYRPQIEAMARDFPLLAPENCLQYFTDLKGVFRSFGYNVLSPNLSTYNVNETYAICFKRHAEACGISYTINQFQVGAAAAAGTTPTDFLYIPAITPSATLQDERISGRKEPNMHFTSVSPGPFYVSFQSDSVNGGSNTEIGFDIKYEIATSCP